MRHTPLILVLLGVLLWSSWPTPSAQAEPVCGPQQVVRAANQFCDRFKLTGKSPFLLVSGRSKAAFYAACKAVVNSGSLIDGLVGTCCAAHDACYRRGGTLHCKDLCDLEFLACTTDELPTALDALALELSVAAAVGGFATFHFTDDPACGE